MISDHLWRAGQAACERWLICVELQRGHAGGYSRSDSLPVQLDNCRAMLAHARAAGWRVVHVHLRRQAAGGAPAAATRPIAGFEPLPSEAVFFRDGGPNCEDHPFWRLSQAEEGSKALVVGFIDDRSCASAVASLSRTGGQVILVDDALGGGYARSFIERRVETAATRDILRDGANLNRRPDWLQAANAP